MREARPWQHLGKVFWVLSRARRDLDEVGARRHFVCALVTPQPHATPRPDRFIHPFPFLALNRNELRSNYSVLTASFAISTVPTLALTTSAWSIKCLIELFQMLHAFCSVRN